MTISNTVNVNMFLSITPTAGSEVVSDSFDAIGELPAIGKTFSRCIEVNRNNVDSSESIYLFRDSKDVKNPDSKRDFSDLEWNITFAIKDVMFNPTQNSQDLTIEDLETKMYNVNERIVKVCVTEKVFEFNGILVSGKITFKLHDEDTDTFVNVNLWLSGQMFLDEYPDTDIYVIPPVESIESLWDGHDDVAVMIMDTPQTYMFEKINEASKVYPNTAVLLELIHYKPDACQSHINLEWGIIYYGKAPSKDQRRSAIIDYIRSNSEREIPEWARHIMPDLYIRNEFILVPMWDLIAVTDDDGRPSMYSGFSDVFNGLGTMATHHSTYPEDHMAEASEVVSFSYRYLSAVCCGSPSNIEGHESLSLIFQDYVPASSSNADYARMSTLTQIWERFMDKLIRAADTGEDTLADGYSMEIINNKKWAVAIHEGVRYVMLARVQ